MPDALKDEVFRLGIGVEPWILANSSWLSLASAPDIPSLKHVLVSCRGADIFHTELRLERANSAAANCSTVSDTADAALPVTGEGHSAIAQLSDAEVEELVQLVVYHLQPGEYRTVQSLVHAANVTWQRTLRGMGEQKTSPPSASPNTTPQGNPSTSRQALARAKQLNESLLVQLILERAPNMFWVVGEYICLRAKTESGDAESEPPPFRAPNRVSAILPSQANNFGGWGSLSAIPTRADVFEILKYVPVNWGLFGNLNIPADVKRRHIRCASTLTWFRRQPFYFEVRNIAGTTEIRRSCVLHPEAHGMTKSDAEERLQWRMARGVMNCTSAITAEDETDWAGAAACRDGVLGKQFRRSGVPLPTTSMRQWLLQRAGAQGRPAGAATTVGREKSVAPRVANLASPSGPSESTSATTTAILKFLKRVCPGYYTTPTLIHQRYTKKNLTEAEIVMCAQMHGELFDVITVPVDPLPAAVSHFPFYTRRAQAEGGVTAVILRRRTGADSARWLDVFLGDLSQPNDAPPLEMKDDVGTVAAKDTLDGDMDDLHVAVVEGRPTGKPAKVTARSAYDAKSDVTAILISMSHMCATWDRPLYVYIRLTDQERLLVGGYDNFCKILRRHPSIFRFGVNFVCRADLSDPLQMQEAEPSEAFATQQQSRIIIREENPYHTPRELALVFHHCCPSDGESTTVTFFAHCCSPAMYAVLPPRLITILQLFPSMFICKEVSPGVFSIRKVVAPKRRKPMCRLVSCDTSVPATANVPAERSAAEGSPSIDGSTTTAQPKEHDNVDEEDLDFGEDETLTVQETIAAVAALVPESGVEASQLLMWVSMNIQQAASIHFGGVLKMVESRPRVFRVEDTAHAKMVFPASPPAAPPTS